MDPELESKRRELERRLAADKRRFPIITAVFVAAMIVILFVAFQFPGVACPGCERTFDDDFGAYCPECGAHGLKVVDKHYKAECRNCEKNLAFTGKTANGRRRLFKIRFCTNCGLSFGQRPL